jgi:hypothetical protein
MPVAAASSCLGRGSGLSLESNDQSVPVPEFDVMAVDKPFCRFDRRSIIGRDGKHFSADEMAIVTNDVGTIIGHICPMEARPIRPIRQMEASINENAFGGLSGCMVLKTAMLGRIESLSPAR